LPHILQLFFHFWTDDAGDLITRVANEACREDDDVRVQGAAVIED
jgi:hypothetical protein